MPVAASLYGTVGTLGTATGPYGLYIDGLNVIKDAAGRYGATDIYVREAGPGDVSECTFSIDDPTAILTIREEAFVVLYDYQRSQKMFAGWVLNPKRRNDFGDQGRTWEVECYGPEKLLDNVIDDGFDIAIGSYGTSTQDAFYDYTVAQGLGAFAPVYAPLVLNNVAEHFSGNVTLHGVPPDPSLVAVTMTPKSIRQAFETWLATALPATPIPGPVALTVDFDFNLRSFVYGGRAGYTPPSGYATITLSDTPAGTLAAENLEWSSGTYGIVNSVRYGPGQWISGDTSTGLHQGSAGSLAEAQQILAANGTPAGRGKFDLTTFTPVAAHPGSSVVITDARHGWTARSFVISQIEKRLNPGLTQNWTVSFFDPANAPTGGPQSLGRAARRLTRNVQN